MTRSNGPCRVRWARDVLSSVAVMALTLASACAEVIHLDPASGDPVLIWNDQTNQAIQATSTDPFRASRALALESIAVFDTVRSIAGAPGFLARLPAPQDVKPAIAAASAAHSMLGLLFPTRRAALDEAFAAEIANEPAGSARDQAVAFGDMMANAVYAMRDRDGWNAAGGINEGTAPGQWRPTPPRLLPPLDPQWAELRPFALTRPNQFRPPGPPAPGTAAFRAAAGVVASIGGAHSAARTAAQTEIARYWSDAIGTYAPAGHWNAIAASLVAPLKPGLEAEAELFAELNVAIADAGVAVADAKYTYWFWRPITALRAGSPGLAPMPDWSPLLETPNHPSYISGHSCFSGAAATILTARFGARPFSFTSASLPGVTRTFKSFQQAADEAAMSRVYGGIHYPFDNADGLATGRAVGAWTVAAFHRLAEDRGPLIVMDRPTTQGFQRTQAPAGFALDNFLPVKTVTARLDGGERFNVAVDDRGRFTLPLRRIGQRDVVLTATSAWGRTATARLGTDSDGGGVVTVPVTVQ